MWAIVVAGAGVAVAVVLYLTELSRAVGVVLGAFCVGLGLVGASGVIARRSVSRVVWILLALVAVILVLAGIATWVISLRATAHLAVT